MAVIVKTAARLESLQMAGHFRRQKTSHVASQVIGMGPDITEATCGARLGGIGSPGGLLLVGRLQASTQPPLNIVRTNRLNLAQFTAQNHLPSLAHKGVAGVVVRDSKDGTGLFNQLDQLFRL